MRRDVISARLLLSAAPIALILGVLGGPSSQAIAGEALAMPLPFGRGGAPIQAPGAPIMDEFGNYYIGRGRSTAYYIDKDGDGRGVGKKSDGSYVTSTSVFTPNIPDPLGNMPDPDDTDPDVYDVPSFLAKWGPTNAGMVLFLAQRKGLYAPTTSRIFYISLTGNDATGQVNDPTHPYLTDQIAITTLKDRQGGTIIYRGGNWGSKTFGNNAIANLNVTGSPGKPVMVMAAPGEQVISTLDVVFSIDPGKTSGEANGNVIFDGFSQIHDWGDGLGQSIKFADHITIQNFEQSGTRYNNISGHVNHALIQDSVIHHISEHAVYFGYGQQVDFTTIPKLANGDTDFVGAEAQYMAKNNNLGGIVSTDVNFIYNIVYNDSVSGWDPIHLNAPINGGNISWNTISTSGGAPIGLQTGVSSLMMDSNVIFDSGREPLTVGMSSFGDCYHSFNQRDNVTRNSTLWTGDPSIQINAQPPSGGVNFTGAYVIDCSALGYPTDFPKQYNWTFRNNVIAAPITNPFEASWGIRFGISSYPSTATIDSNLLYNTRGVLSPATDPVLLIANSNDSVANGSYGITTMNGLTAGITNNQYANPLFVDASYSGYALTPGKFSLAPMAGSPAIGAGASTGASKVDIRGVLRSTSAPTIGAYEYRSSTAPSPLAFLMASSRVIEDGGSVTLTWTSIGASSCTGVGFSTGGAANGNVTVTPSVTTDPTATSATDAAYGLTCAPDGSHADSAGTPDLKIEVLTTALAPTITLTGPSNVASGGSGSLSYSVDGGGNYYACNGGNVAPVNIASNPGFWYNTPLSGTVTIFPPNGGKTYQLICMDRKGVTRMKTWTVSVP